MSPRTAVITAILSLTMAAGILVQSPAGTPQAMTVAEAKALLRQGFDLREQKDYQAAIRVLEKVVAFDPWLEANFPEEKIQLQATGELAITYYVTEDWEKALPLFEQFDTHTREKNPNADLLSPAAIAQCREQLALMGKLDRGPMVVVGNQYFPEANKRVDGVTLAPITKLAKLLGIQVKREGNQLTLVGTGANPKSMVLTNGSKNAIVGGKSISLPVATAVRGNDLFVPLRAVAEYFGAQVKWDPLPRIASVQ